DSIQAMVAAAHSACGRIDILVNNAGCNIRKPALDVTWDDWNTILDTNLRGTFFVAQAVARHMIRAFEPCQAVVTPSASCATMVRRHLPELFEHEPQSRDAALALASRTFEFSEFLRSRLNVRLEDHLRFDQPVTFHYPCHARDIYSAADLATLMLAAAGPQLRPPEQVDLCCGFGGMFAVDYPGISGGLLDDKLAQLSDTGAATVICNEGGCALQIAGGAHRRGLPLGCKHVGECLAESLRLMDPAP
ncbi:MAG TPA: SDR family oxidoreductase, partial [Phycisphaerae bacterium]|nr:SDR family oxidoreductase [Phycisphaerae bacterium]